MKPMKAMLKAEVIPSFAKTMKQRMRYGDPLQNNRRQSEPTAESVYIEINPSLGPVFLYRKPD